MMGDKEVKLIDTELLRTNIAQIAKACAKSDKQKALVGRILFMIENMPTVESQPDNGWISVKDRLPENETEVLIYCPELVCTIKLAMWIEDGFYVDKEDLIIKAEPNGYCTHWMPLPEPPKEDKDGKD